MASQLAPQAQPHPTPSGGGASQARKFLEQIRQITLQLNRQTQHPVPSKKVQSEGNQSSAAAAGQERGKEGAESSHPGQIPRLPSSSGLPSAACLSSHSCACLSRCQAVAAPLPDRPSCQAEGWEGLEELFSDWATDLGFGSVLCIQSRVWGLAR